MPLTGLLALALDWALFARLRERASAITVVMASFGASMALRSLLEFLFTSRPAYFSRELQIAMRFGGRARHAGPARAGRADRRPRHLRCISC